MSLSATIYDAGFRPRTTRYFRFRRKYPKPFCPAVDIQGRINAARGWLGLFLTIRCISSVHGGQIHRSGLRPYCLSVRLAALRFPCSRLQVQGLPSCATLSCFAWKTGADPPWSARSPGRGSTGPSASLRLTHGKPVQRGEGSLDLRLYPLHPCPAPCGTQLRLFSSSA